MMLQKVMTSGYTIILYSVCRAVAERTEENKRKYPTLSGEKIIFCGLQAHMETMQKSLENWHAGVPCCSGCISEMIFKMTPHGFSEEKKNMFTGMYYHAFNILKAMDESDLLQTVSLDPNRFEQIFTAFMRRYGPEPHRDTCYQLTISRT